MLLALASALVYEAQGTHSGPQASGKRYGIR
jgi:hypothetical protein